MLLPSILSPCRRQRGSTLRAPRLLCNCVASACRCGLPSARAPPFELGQVVPPCYPALVGAPRARVHHRPRVARGRPGSGGPRARTAHHHPAVSEDYRRRQPRQPVRPPGRSRVGRAHHLAAHLRGARRARVPGPAVSGSVFNKLPRTPRTFWHQDGISWNHPLGYEPEPIELIVIYYPVDTSPANGCLRVIPGSHRRRHPLHDLLHGSYTADLRMMADPASPASQTFADELALPVSAGMP